MQTAWSLLLVLGCVAMATVRCDDDEEGGGFSPTTAWNMVTGTFSSVFGSTESAPYSVVNTNGSFEIRQYPANKWVCTSAEVDSEDIRQSGDDEKMFRKLFRYITGQNKQKENIEMTTPVTVHYTAMGEGKKKAEMCFYVPEQHQESPAEPQDSSVTIQERPAHEALTVRRGGYPDAEDWKEMYVQLKKFAEEHQYSGYDMENFYSAGYDAPFKFWNRRNEMWFTKPM